MLEQYKKDIKKEFEKYWERCDSVKNTNNKYFDESKYSKQFIDDIKREEQEDIQGYKNDFYQNVRKLRDVYISGLKADTETINTMEYQVRLSNVLRLVEMSEGAISNNLLDFMVKANDTDTLRLLASKFSSSSSIQTATRESDLSYAKEDIKTLCQVAENHVGYESLGATRSSILSSFN